MTGVEAKKAKDERDSQRAVLKDVRAMSPRNLRLLYYMSVALKNNALCDRLRASR